MNKNKLTKILCLTAVLLSASQLDAGSKPKKQHNGGGNPTRTDTPLAGSNPPVVVSDENSSEASVAARAVLSTDGAEKVFITAESMRTVAEALQREQGENSELYIEIVQKGDDIAKLTEEVKVTKELLNSSNEGNEKKVSDLEAQLNTAKELLNSSNEGNEKKVSDLEAELNTAKADQERIVSKLQLEVKTLTDRVAEQDVKLLRVQVTQASLDNLDALCKLTQRTREERIAAARAEIKKRTPAE